MAVVLSIQDYRRLGGKPKPPWDVVAQVRAKYDFEELDVDPDEVFDVEKDPSPGDDFSW